MRETLHNHLRPIKPYDMVLGIGLALLFVGWLDVGRLAKTGIDRAHLVIYALPLVWVLCLMQRVVKVPTPAWQALAVIGLNSGLILGIGLWGGAGNALLVLLMVSCAFATMSFGEMMGMVAVGLSVLVMILSTPADREFVTKLTEWGLAAFVLFAEVAILGRVGLLYEGAVLDPVTTLRNHRFFQVRLREELHRCDRYNRSTTLLMFDLDDFKKVNDRYGHGFGDQVLASVGKEMQKHARATDIVSRFGGEEFAIILPETPLHSAVQVAERIRTALERLEGEHGVKVTASFGVVTYPQDAPNADELIAAGENAMNEAKRSGKNQVRTKQQPVAPVPSA